MQLFFKHPATLKHLFSLLGLCYWLLALPTLIAAQPIQPIEFDLNTLQKNISHAPPLSADHIGNAPIISLPLPTGETARYWAYESPVLDIALSAQYPDIKTYAVKGIDDPTASGRFAITPQGFDALILTEKGNLFINNKAQTTAPNALHSHSLRHNTTAYFCYYEHQLPLATDILSCSTLIDAHQHPDETLRAGSCGDNGIYLKTYRLVVSTTGEFTAQHGGTVSNALSYITTIINNLNAVYERDLAVHLNIVTANSLIYTSSSTDPYAPTSSTTLLSQAQNAISGAVASTNYDLGVVFHYGGTGGGGGVAELNAVCQSSIKASAWCAENNNYNQWLKLTMHEIGHLFGATHSFYGNESYCSSRTATSACEPGSGTTIMSYSGSCGSQNIGSYEGDTYFNAINIQQIVNFINTIATCHSTTQYGNAAPDVYASPSGTIYTIPANTPFALTAAGTDSNSDAITYCWEQSDMDNTGGSAPNNAASSTTAPLFRSFLPSTNPTRYFPQLSDILANTQTLGEILPQINRSMNFRVLLRDNHVGSGATDCDETSVNVVNTGSAFAITSQNSSGTVWTSGANATVIWNTANTMSAPISCANVKILLSTDGGNTFPYTIVNSTANDGSETFYVPPYPTGSGRIMVKAIDNIFFDINNSNITIISPCTAEAAAIAPSTAVSGIAGATSLDLALAPQYGTASNSITGTVALSDPSMNLTFKGSTGTCQTAGNSPHYHYVPFMVNSSGSYTFTFASSGSGALPSKIMNLYQTSFSANNSCNNWLNSSGTYNGSAVSLSSNFVHNLSAGTNYVLVISGFNASNVGSYTVNITPPSGGSVYIGGTPAPNSSYSYTYIAVNSANNIVLVNSSSNLSTLGGGNYSVYGLSYLTTGLSNPNSLVGTSLSSLQNNIATGALCADLSSNYVTVGITSACPLSANFTYSANQATYSFNASSSVGASSYTWNFGDGSSGSGVSPTHTYSNSGVYTISLSITGSCGTTATQQTINYVCADVPTPNFIYTVSNNVYNMLLFGAQSGITYTWNWGDGSATQQGSSPTHYYSVAGKYTLCATANNGCNSTTYCDTVRVVRAILKVYLEGAALNTASEMNTSLVNSGLLPTQQPYNAAPWYYSGGETIANNSPIRSIATDWVLVEILDSLDNLLERQAAILTKYGDIRKPDGTLSGILLHNLRNNGHYKIAIRHRNHLPIVTLNTDLVISHLLPYDFTNSNAQVANGTLVNLTNGTMGMCAGDVNANGVINFEDANIITSSINAGLSNTYIAADINLSNSCFASDFQVSSPNIGKLSDRLLRY
jgi:PKD repeat protein